MKYKYLNNEIIGYAYPIFIKCDNRYEFEGELIISGNYCIHAITKWIYLIPESHLHEYIKCIYFTVNLKQFNRQEKLNLLNV